MIESLEEIRKTCKRRDIYLRILIFLVGIPVGEIVLSQLGDSWHNWLGRVVIAFLSGLILLAISEVVIGIGYMEFYSRCKFANEFNLKHLIHHFIEEHKEYLPAERAKVALSIILADRSMNNVEMKMPFPYYLKLLSAAAVTTQNEWFATYRMPIGKWGEIKKHSVEYFDVLSNARMRKTRVVVRPQEEVDTVSYDSEIVLDTLETGAALCCVKISEDLVGIDDYAIFDDELVITATPLHADATSEVLGLNDDPYFHATDLNRHYSVRLLRGPDAIGEYITDKKRLMTIVKKDCIKFTSSGRNKKRKEAGENTHDVPQPAVG